MTDYISREALEKWLLTETASLDSEEDRQYVVERLRNELPAADVVPGSDFRDCRNELCLHCGFYKNAHEGACEGCRWRDKSDAES